MSLMLQRQEVVIEIEETEGGYRAGEMSWRLHWSAYTATEQGENYSRVRASHRMGVNVTETFVTCFTIHKPDLSYTGVLM